MRFHSVRLFLWSVILGFFMLACCATQTFATDVLMVLWRGPTESEASFRISLQALVGPVTFTEINGDQDRAVLAKLLRTEEARIRSGKYSLIYTYGSTVTEMVASFVGEAAPIVFNIVAAPMRAGFVQSTEKPGRNITGVTNGVEIQAQFDALKALGAIRRLAVLFNPREPNSNILMNDVRTWAKLNGAPLREFRAAPGTDALDRAIAQLSAADAREDVLYIPADTYLASEAYKIIAALGKKLRIYGGTETFVLRGALATYAPEVIDMGIAASEAAARVIKGDSPAFIPVQLPQPRLIIGKQAAESRGLEIPAGALVRELDPRAARNGLMN